MAAFVQSQLPTIEQWHVQQSLGGRQVCAKRLFWRCVQVLTGSPLKRNGLLFAILLLCVPDGYATATWQVTPNVCITKKLGDLCALQAQITLRDIPAGKYCLYQDGALLQCWSESPQKHQVTLSYAEDMHLSLVDGGGNTILVQRFTIKGRSAPPSRRRVRQPWSLF